MTTKFVDLIMRNFKNGNCKLTYLISTEVAKWSQIKRCNFIVKSEKQRKVDFSFFGRRKNLIFKNQEIKSFEKPQRLYKILNFELI